EKNLFNNELFIQLEKLKPQYFDETDAKTKAALKRKIDGLINHLTNGKETFDFEIYFSEVFHTKGGFDVLIGNPPYIGEKGHKELFLEVKNGPLVRFYLGKMDYFYFFFHLALNIGRKNAQIAFITTNYYLTAFGAKKLREDFKSRSSIRHLTNLNELKIFESALGQHNIITILSKTKNEKIMAMNCLTRRRGFSNSEILQCV
ncbi:MAG: Eco57I restriction-modification methylase domain-containing protein, partial [Deltaproteobacteria bacterium]|nr:Eco57I restriction-modification methylase domain-containing protein [Deltaproteobacteria bacterium]